ncbi:MAG: CpaE family protein [Chloroflexota bacterium]
MPASSILLLDADATAAATISSALTSAGYLVSTVDDADDAFRQAPGHNLIIVDIVPGVRTVVDVCQEIRRTPSLAAIPILCISQTDDVEERIRFLETGADDVMARPFDARELEARIEALLVRFARTKQLAPVFATGGGTVGGSRRRIIGVFSPKGGAGTTTIATNVAMLQAQKHPDTVVVIDLDLQFGQVVTHLNVEPSQTLLDLVRDDTAMREAELMRTYATRHDAGLHVLAAPPAPEFAELITPTHVNRILSIILETYDTVVVDAGSTLDERAISVFEHAETIIIPVQPEIPALKTVHSLLDYFSETTSIGAKSLFVLNNTFAKEILRQGDVESALGTKITAELPYDPLLYLKAVNAGIPLVVGAPKSIPAERFGKLATTLFGLEEPETNGTGPALEPVRRGGLMARLRRS